MSGKINKLPILQSLVLPRSSHDYRSLSIPNELEISSLLHVLSIPGAYDLVSFRGVLKNCQASLVCLDLSNHYGDLSHLTYLLPEEGFSNLVVLKLRGIRLGWEKIREFLQKLKAPLFSLDLSRCNLGIQIIQLLTLYLACSEEYGEQNSISWSDYPAPPPRYMRKAGWQRDGERITRLDPSDWKDVDEVAHRNDSVAGISKFLARQTSNAMTHHSSLQEFANGTLATEDFEIHDTYGSILHARTKLTHVHLGCNKASIHSILDMLKGRGIQHLDLCGSMPEARIYELHEGKKGNWDYELNFGKLKHSSYHRLHYLRIHHSFVTGVCCTATHDGARLSHAQTIYAMEARARSEAKETDPPGIFVDPRQLPSLHTLVLTRVPRQTTGQITKTIKSLCDNALLQEDLVAQAKVESGSTSRFGPAIYTGLRVLGLEMADAVQDHGVAPHDNDAMEDDDIQGFHNAVEKDFSFFDTTSSHEASALEGSVHSLNVQRVEAVEESEPIYQAQIKLLDVCDEIRRFRKLPQRQWSGRIEVRG